MLQRTFFYSLLIGGMLFPLWSWAVDPGVLWLPKKYSDARPKLMRAARDAENMERCKVVIAGEMIVSKNTSDEYYFVITCRDAGRRSYNLSYQYPRTSDGFELLAEQRSSLSTDKESTTLPGKDGVTREHAITMCTEALAEETVLTDWTEVLEDSIQELEHDNQWVFHLQFPFQGKNRFDELVEFNSDCYVDKKGVAQLELGKLHKEQALENCYEGLEDESILIGRIEVLFDQVSEVSHESQWAYRYNLPFTSKNKKAELVRYNADCLVSEDGDAEVETRVDVESIQNMCIDAVKKEARMMMSVQILQDKIQPVEEQEYNFYVQIPFDATDPVGRSLHYVGECNVNDAGRSQVDIKPFLK